MKRIIPGFGVSDIDARAKLDQNEAPGDISRRVKDAVLGGLRAKNWGRYPQPSEYLKVKSVFAKRLGVKPEEIFITAGADQVIQGVFMLAMNLFGTRNRALIFEPTYPMYRHFAKALGIRHELAELGWDYAISSDLITKRFSLINIVSPNNPTGDLVDDKQLQRIIRNNREALIFIDEAYGDFSGRTYLNLFRRNKNVIICRSLSKVRLAGLRIGYGIANPDYTAIIEALLLAPYNLSHLQLSVVDKYPILKTEINRSVGLVRREKKRFFDYFVRRNIEFRNSEGNFVLFRIVNAASLYSDLLRRGVKVRDVSALPGLKDCLRVTVGTARENSMFFREMNEWEKLNAKN